MAETKRQARMERLIQAAFLDLVQERGFRAVTVQAIADRALINRQTFYNYYHDKYELTDQLVATTFAQLTEFFDRRFTAFTSGASPAVFRHFLEQQEQAAFLSGTNRRRLLTLLDIQYDRQGLAQRCQDYAASRLATLLPARSPVVIQAITGLFAQIFRASLIRGRFLTPGEVADLRATLNRMLAE